MILSMLKGVGPATLRNIAKIKDFAEYDWSEIAQFLPKQVANDLSDQVILNATDAADSQIDIASKNATRILSVVDADYPKLLCVVRDDPVILFVKGALAPTEEKSVAIIGTREPTSHGGVITERLTKFFVGEGWSIVSGLAIGCDSIAHKAALINGGHTVAILAHGLQTVAPSRHKKLAAEILEAGGALVTEYPFGDEPRPQNFVKRDRIQAGMASGVVMVQSDIKGGSLHASRASLEYNRWLAVPYPTEQDKANGEPKIQANLLLSEFSDKEKTDLLKCKEDDLSRLFILRSKSDYSNIIIPLKKNQSSTSKEPEQGILL